VDVDHKQTDIIRDTRGRPSTLLTLYPPHVLFTGMDSSLCPQTWNDLPEDVTSAESVTTFHRILKTHLFRKSFPDYLLDIN